MIDDRFYRCPACNLDMRYGGHRDGCAWASIESAARARGLYIITAAEKAVLDSIKTARITQTAYGPHMNVDDVEDITSKELARRSAE